MIKILCVLLITGLPLWANAEYRSARHAGINAETLGYGHVTAFGTNSLSLLDTPANILGARGQLSGFYTSMMNGDVDLMAAAYQHTIANRLLIGVGYINESIDAGYETSLVNESVVAGDSLSFSSSEYVVNATFYSSPSFVYGASAHIYNRDAFGITGEGESFSLGFRYETNRFGLSAGGKHLNSPSVTYSNEAQEILYPEYYVALKRKVPFLPTTLYGQLNYTPDLSTSHYGTGLRVSLSRFLRIHVGYMQIRNFGSNISEQLTVGTRVKLSGLWIDYTFNSADYLDSSDQHRFGLSISY